MLAVEFRNGSTFEMEGSVYRVVDFMHVKPGKGSAFVRTTLKNVITGKNLERTFNPTDKFDEAEISVQEMQYLYQSDDLYTFMDTTTYEQAELTKDQISDVIPYLKDGILVKVLSYKGNIFGVEPPTFVELEVTYTEPGIKGSTATGTTKPATVETGAQFNVPIFVEIGDRIRIDTRTGSYMERAN